MQQVISVEERRRRAMCLGKQRFPNPQMARKVARRQKGRDSYRCEFCGGWHMGNVRPKRR